MAKPASYDQLRKITQRISEEDLLPGNLAKKYGTKSALDTKAAETMEFIDSFRPDISDKDAFEQHSSIKNRLAKNFVTARSLAPASLDSGENKFDELNRTGRTRVSSKDPAASILEKESSIVDPHEFKEAQRHQNTETPRMGVDMNIDEAKRKALENVSGSSRKSGKLKGKLGAISTIAGALGAIGSAGASESIDPRELLKAGAEIVNPLPFDLEEIKEETGKLTQGMQGVVDEQMQKRQEESQVAKQQREEQALPGALEFSDEFKKMQNDAKRNALMSLRRR